MKAAWSCVVVALILAFAAPASADNQPWAQGITEAQKAEAQKQLEAGNKLFLAQNYKEALTKYETAIKSWDHPAIRFNMVRCLIQLDRPVDAFDSLQLALKYGAAPLEEAVYTEALSYQKLLANEIATLEVACSEAGARVTLDGQPLMTCPGREKRRISPGSHGVVAIKDGFLTKELEVVVVGGKAEVVELKMTPLAGAARIAHRWPTWIPWVVFGGSLMVTGVGGLIKYSAASKMDDFDKDIGTQCAVSGCDLEDPMYADLKAKHDDAKFQDKIAITVLSVGAVGAIGGGIMLFMNRGRTVYDNEVEKRGPSPGNVRLDVVPTRGGGSALLLSGRF
jgi:hypothetical protein